MLLSLLPAEGIENMPDVVVTVPKNFEYYDPKTKRELKGIKGWIAEGDAAGAPESGVEWSFTLGGYPPRIEPGERVYVVYNGKLRGYAPLVRIDRFQDEDDLAGDFGDLEQCPPRRRVGAYGLIRKGGAVAVTIDEFIKGFRGFRYRWWSYDQERPFPDWQTP